jgi:hypothetical protein
VPAAPVEAEPKPLAAVDAAETVSVDPSLFTTQVFQWKDAARDRSVPAKLYLPARPSLGAGSVPLVVFSHGIGGSMDGYSYLGRYFAAHGYASLHVQHVGSDRQIWRGNPLTLVSRLSDAAQDTEALHRVKAEEKGLELQVLTSSGSDVARMGDPHRLIQILNNLLSNAIKFTDHGHVRLKLSCRPGKPVTFDVSDTGAGMTEAQVSRVFESFEQADGSISRRFGGTGLGLSIVRQLILLMGGMISIQSRPGEGTDVRVIIPLPEAVADRTPIAGTAEALDTRILAGKRLLVADDNLTNRIVLSEMLAQTDVKVTLVENGHEAVSGPLRVRLLWLGAVGARASPCRFASRQRPA